MVSKSPAHYTRGNIEVWDFVRDQQLNYHLGNAIKYICRAGYKGSKGEDLEKAIHYLENELDHITNCLHKSHSDMAIQFRTSVLRPRMGLGEPDYAKSLIDEEYKEFMVACQYEGP